MQTSILQQTAIIFVVILISFPLLIRILFNVVGLFHKCFKPINLKSQIKLVVNHFITFFLINNIIRKSKRKNREQKNMKQHC